MEELMSRIPPAAEMVMLALLIAPAAGIRYCQWLPPLQMLSQEKEKGDR
jgi:hypothetical protein